MLWRSERPVSGGGLLLVTESADDGVTENADANVVVRRHVDGVVGTLTVAMSL
ncbi:hypothetical protein ACFWAY_44375 [Rhodococcus sp. NPDC059968]|uniref:hypothetical protein n=1 Tax=Rhodococcus sp. NPDC059968 TaxID=3347017 RepID=UPI00366B32B9